MVGAVLLLSQPGRAAVPFPDEGGWLPLQRLLLPLEDLQGDLAGVEDPSLDLVGDAALSSLWWTADDETFFLRARVADRPSSGGLWGFLITLDGNNDNWELLLTVEGQAAVLRAATNPTGAFGIQPDRSLTDPLGYGSRATGETRSVVEGGASFVDLQLPRAVLEGELGVLRSGALRIAGVSGVTWDQDLLDVAGCDGLAGPCTALAPVVADVIRLDFDADGLVYPRELELGTDPNDPDSDDDGALDGEEAVDADGGGLVDALECDADADGLPDGLERGVTAASPSTDLGAGCFLPDADPGTTTHPGRADTDGGGWSDAVEDVDRDGAVGRWETDPTVAGDDRDGDGDGIADVLDDRRGVGADDDSDGDGLTDGVEGLSDPDDDGLASFVDDDSDGDGWSDADEGGVDTDADGLPDAVDPDSDEDGLPDALEHGVERLDPDADDDGLLDGQELGDDVHDPDSDDDGIPDGVEGTADTDGDLVPDVHDDDSDGDGLTDAVEFDWDQDGLADDTDGDHLPDFQDLDSDDDDVVDADERDGDGDCDGLPDRLDAFREDGFCDEATVPTVDTGASPPDPTAEAPDPFARPGGFGGGACDSAGVGAAGWLVVALAGALARRRRLVMALLVPGVASAQEVDADHFAPSVDGGELVLTETVGEDTRAGASAWLDHADDPLVYRADDGEQVPVLHAVSTLRLLGFVRAGPLRFGAEVPVHASVSGERVDSPMVAGDVRLSTETLVACRGPARLGFLVDGTLPTGDPAISLGAGRATVKGGAALTFDTEPVLVGLDLGVRSGTGRSLGSLEVSPAAVGSLGVAWRVVDGFALAAEASGELWLGQDQPGASPVEALLSARRSVGDVGALHLGAGTGLTSGVGAPDLRLALGVSWWLGAVGR